MVEFAGRNARLLIGTSVDRGSDSFRDNVELGVRLEKAGFDFIGVGDNGAETFALAGALAVATSTVRITSNIAIWTRSPATMAHASNTVANLAGGRFDLGIGPAPRAWIVEQHGMAYDPLIGRMREYLAAVRACLDATPGNPTKLDGRYFPTHGYNGWGIEVPERVSLHLAATQPQMTSLAAEMSDGVRINSVPPNAWVKEEAPKYISKGLAKRSSDKNDPMVSVARFLGVHPDRETAYDLCRRQISFYFKVPYLRTLLEPYGFEAELDAGEEAVNRGDEKAAVQAVSDRMVDAMAIAGTEGEVREKVAEIGKHVDALALAAGMNMPGTLAIEHMNRVIAAFSRE